MTTKAHFLLDLFFDLCYLVNKLLFLSCPLVSSPIFVKVLWQMRPYQNSGLKLELCWTSRKAVHYSLKLIYGDAKVAVFIIYYTTFYRTASKLSFRSMFLFVVFFTREIFGEHAFHKLDWINVSMRIFHHHKLDIEMFYFNDYTHSYKESVLGTHFSRVLAQVSNMLLIIFLKYFAQHWLWHKYSTGLLY